MSRKTPKNHSEKELTPIVFLSIIDKDNVSLILESQCLSKYYKKLGSLIFCYFQFQMYYKSLFRVDFIEFSVLLNGQESLYPFFKLTLRILF